ncbi:MAG TPA: hypothetical protein DEH78_06610 [Solibacterales bacterium]|nr:hypothetical protein [Bryobacterales bacterium]
MAAASCGWAQDAGDLVARSIAAEEDNRRRAISWLYREAVISRFFEKDRLRRRTETNYEVLFVEGQPYYRMTGRDGRPLAGAEKEEEDARMQRVAEERRANPNKIVVSDRPRLAILYRVVPETHEVTLAGSEVVEGRDAWRLVAKPRRSLAPRETRVLETRAVDLLIWVDKASLMRVKQEAVALRNAGRFRKGDRVTHSFEPHADGGEAPTWLVKRITLRRPFGKNERIEVDQVYSEYRRFAADSRITIEPQWP